jgi:hypothetical protein
MSRMLPGGMTMRMKRIGARALSLALSVMLVQVTAIDAVAQATPTHLQITILDGEGALNNIKQRTAREPIIQVQDENHKPVAGAAVIFLLPDSGPSGTFLDGTRSFATTTDTEGRAVAKGLTPNKVQGKFQIRVRVKTQDGEAETVIAQTNILEHIGGTSAHAFPTKWVVVGAVAAGAIAGGIIATSGGHSTTITPGDPTVGPPPQSAPRR